MHLTIHRPLVQDAAAQAARAAARPAVAGLPPARAPRRSWRWRRRAAAVPAAGRALA